MTTNSNTEDDDSDDPLPLCELRNWLSAKTYAWLEELHHAAARRSEAAELLEEAAAATANLFRSNDDDDDDLDDARVRYWTSSATRPDGIGGYDERRISGDDTDDIDKQQAEGEPLDDADDDDDAVVRTVRVPYILSPASGGHGDDVWAASRHVANLFCNATKCRQLLAPLLSKTTTTKQQQQHPLFRQRLLELGAGAGIPSLAALHCGATVVCTDQSSVPHRLQCLAEAMERNYYRVLKKQQQQQQQQEYNDDALRYARQSRVCPYDWGSSILDEDMRIVEEDANDQNILLFDVVLAADCVYMPACHALLLDSIQKWMKPGGMALLPFALHGNTDDDRVWKIVEMASQSPYDFCVEQLESQQLTPQCSSMDPKRGLVHTLRLTRQVHEN